VSEEGDAALRPGEDERGRAVAYGVTWLSYASYYFGRKGLGVAKASIEAALGKGALVGVETAYLAAYAVGQYVNGWAGDRVGARRLIGYGMLVSALACFAFGASTAGTLFFAAMVVNGFAQSTGWPGNIKAMAEWTPPERRGAVMGGWSTSYQVGGVVATSVAALLIRAWGWTWGFHGAAVMLALVGVVVLALLRPGPLAAKPAAGADAGQPSPELAEARRRLVRSPLIWSYGVSYFCLKLIRYSLLLWLPYYLEKVLGYPGVRAAFVSNAFEVGGIAGSILVGLLSDRLRKRLPRGAVPAISLLLLALAFLIYPKVGTIGVAANVAGLMLIGFLLFGPDSLISGAAAQDAGGPVAAALAAGLINGIGSLGAVAQEAVTRGVSAKWGWDGLFLVFVALSVLAAVCLIPALKRPAPSAPEA
jgi:sugar phosphate permease